MDMSRNTKCPTNGMHGSGCIWILIKWLICCWSFTSFQGTIWFFRYIQDLASCNCNISLNCTEERVVIRNGAIKGIKGPTDWNKILLLICIVNKYNLSRSVSVNEQLQWLCGKRKGKLNSRIRTRFISLRSLSHDVRLC